MGLDERRRRSVFKRLLHFGIRYFVWGRYGHVGGNSWDREEFVYFYFIYAVGNQAIEKGEHIPTFLIADRDGCTYFLLHQPTTERTPDYLITDTKGRSNPFFTKQYIHVSSINNVN